MSPLALILLGVFMFTFIVLVLVSIILVAKSQLVASGSISIDINGDSAKTLSVPVGGKLLNVLAERDIFLPSACGGGGTCGECRIVVKAGGGDVLPTERAKLNRRQVREKYRLSCQLSVKDNLALEVPPELFEIRKWHCTVRSNENVATFIKELVLELPEGDNVDFRAGGYIQIEAPPHSASYQDFEVEDEYKADWDKFNLWRYTSVVKEPVIRAYSMAQLPGREGHHHAERSHRDATAVASGRAAGPNVFIPIQSKAG